MKAYKNRRYGLVSLLTAYVLFFAGCNSPGYDADKDNGGGGTNEGGTSGGGTGGGGTNVIPTITIQNNTGYDIGYSYNFGGVWIKKSTTAYSWGDNLAGYTSSFISDGTSRTFTFSQPLSSNNKYDFRLNTSSGGEHSFRKYGVTITNDMTLTFTTSDLNDGSAQPNVVIQNRSGKIFDSVHIKPSVSSDWGSSFGSISNNSNLSSTILIPPSNYTEFDIQMKSTNPTNTYTRNNVTISNGMILTFTSADADNSTIELPVIVIQNNTGYSIGYSYDFGGVWISPSTSTSWGDNLAGYSSSFISDGESRAFSLPQHLSVNSVYDIMLRSSSGNFTFTKKNLTVSEGMIVIFTTSDLE